MNLDVIFQLSQTVTMEEVQSDIERYFNQKIRLIKEEHSIFEQWQVRSADHIFIPKAWTYRLIYRDGVYYFGTIQ
jgi:hypothetical protein